MRDIKFRGKSLCTGEFAYGYLVKYSNNTTLIVAEAGNYSIKPETIGQFTGLHDKNGKEIYEGDVLKLWRNGKEFYIPLEVKYCPLWCQFIVENEQGKEQFGIWQEFDEFEIIGNIHETPELTKAQE